MGPRNNFRVKALTILAILPILLSLPLPRAAATSGGTLDPPPYSEYNQDTNNNGLADWLVVNVSLNVASPGIFRVEGTLTNATAFVAYASLQISLGPGARAVGLPFYGGQIRNSRQVGNYTMQTYLYNDQGTRIDTQVWSQGFHNWTAYDGAEASIASFTSTGVDTDGDILYNWLRASAQVQVNSPGRFLLQGQLRRGSTDIAQASEQRVLAAGTRSFNLQFSGPTINHLGINGPYNITLSLLNTTAVLQDVKTSATGALNATGFDPASVRLNRAVAYTNATLDLDGNGKGDILAMDATVRVVEPSSFTLRGTLWNGAHTRRIAAAATAGNATNPGNVTVRLRLSGYAINRTGDDAPYKLDFALEDDAYGPVDSDTYTIGSRTHNDFDRPHARLAPPHGSNMRDTNGDGRANLLQVNVSVSVVEAGGFLLQGTVQGNNRTLATAANLTYLTPGTRTIPLRFSGPQLQLGGVAGPYNVTLTLSSMIQGLGPDPLVLDEGYHISVPVALGQLEAAAPATLVGKVTNATGGAPLKGVRVKVANYTDAFVGQVTTNATGEFLLPLYAGRFTAIAEGPRGLQPEVHTLTVTSTTSHNWTLGAPPPDTGAWNAAFADWNTTGVAFNLTRRVENQSLRFNADSLQGLDGYAQQWELDTFLAATGSSFLPADTGRIFSVDGTLYNLRARSAVQRLSGAGAVTSTLPLGITGNGTYDARTPIPAAVRHWVNSTPDYPGPGEDPMDTLRFPERYALLSSTVVGNVSASGRGTTTATLHPGRDPNPTDGFYNAWVYLTAEDDAWAPTIAFPTAVPDPREYPGGVNLTATVTDKQLVASVVVQVWDSTPSSLGTSTMDAAGGGVYYYNIPTLANLGTYSYTVTALDGVGNSNATTRTFVVRDTTPAVVAAFASDVASQEVHGFVNLTATVTDNYGVQTVQVTIAGPSGTAAYAMARVGSTSAWFYRARYDLLGSYSFSVSATDASGNLATTSTKGFAMVDTTPPLAAAGADRAAERGTNVTLDGSGSSDNYGVTNYTWTFAFNGTNVVLYGATVAHAFGASGTYNVTLRVRDSSGNSAADVVVVVVTDTTPPATPTIPGASRGISDTTVVITWSPVATADVVGYNVYRSNAPGGPWVKLNGQPVQGSSYTDPALELGTTYYYRVTAVDREGNESPPSAVASHSTPIPLFAPTGMGTLVILAMAAGSAAGALALRHHRRRPGKPSAGPERYGQGGTLAPSPPEVGTLAPPPAADSAPIPPVVVPQEAPPPASTPTATSEEDELLLLLNDVPKRPRKKADDDLDLDLDQ